MKKFLGTLAFWGLVIIGPVAIMLWNKFSYIMAGLGYGEGSFFYNALLLISQGLACGMAYIALLSITKEPGGYCARYNCLICAVAMAGLAISDINLGETFRAATLGIGAVASCICLGCVIKDYGNTAKNEKQEEPKTNTKRKDDYLVPVLLALAIAILAFAIGVEVGKTVGY